MHVSDANETRHWNKTIARSADKRKRGRGQRRERERERKAGYTHYIFLTPARELQKNKIDNKRLTIITTTLYKLNITWKVIIKKCLIIPSSTSILCRKERKEGIYTHFVYERVHFWRVTCKNIVEAKLLL